MSGFMIFIIVIVIILVLLALCVVRIVPQAYAMVIERLGGYLTTWNVGIHFKVPADMAMKARFYKKEA